MLDKLLLQDKQKWNKALSNEFGRLTQSNAANVRCADAIDFIRPIHITSNEKITLASFVCDHCALKPKKWRTRLVIGEDKLPYYEDVDSTAAKLLECKLLFNSIISDASKGVCFMTLDLKDHFLA